MGCYHFQLPNVFNKIKDGEFKGLEKKDWPGLKKYLKPAFNIEEFRHREANWWGVKALWDVHKLIDTEWGNSSGKIYPDEIQKKLNEINNLLAEFLISKIFQSVP